MECLGCRGELRRVRRSKASWVVVGVDLLLPSRVARLNFASRRRSVKRAGTSTVGRSARIPQIRVVALQSIGGLQERADFSASWSPLLKSQRMRKNAELSSTGSSTTLDREELGTSGGP